MIDTKPFTDKQWWKMCDVNLDLPEPLGRANKSRPFVYDRKWGLFHCPPGHHPAAMGLLLAFHHGMLCRLEVAEKLSLDVPYGAADYYLEHTPGTAYMSSVGVRRVRTWGKDSLNAFERRQFGALEYLNPWETQ